VTFVVVFFLQKNAFINVLIIIVGRLTLNTSILHETAVYL